MGLLTACTGQDSDESGTQSPVQAAADQAQRTGWDTQYEALRDGMVTPTEYRDALDRFLACMGDAGLETTSPVLNLSDGLRYRYEITLPPGATEVDYTTALDDCEARYLRLTEDTYLATSVPVTDPPLMAGMIDCLRALNLPVTGDETNFSELQAEPGNATGDQLATCVQEVGQRLYPGQIIPFGFDPN